MIGERFFVTERTEEAQRSRREELDGWGVGGPGAWQIGGRRSEFEGRGHEKGLKRRGRIPLDQTRQADV